MKYLLTILIMTLFITPKNPYFDFEKGQNGQKWRVVNDGVMGGLSQGQLSFTKKGTAIFEGDLSLENNGGFASIRSPQQPYQLSEFKGFKIRVKGDGREYGLTLSHNYYFTGVYYNYYFQTKKGKWQELTIPFEAIKGYYFGYQTDEIPRLAPNKVKEIGIILSDKKTGPFKIEVDWIDLY